MNQDGLGGEDWVKVFSCLRPGSRTILYRPEGLGVVLRFARRGFRLLIVHHDATFLAQCKTELRAEGLASLLMGSYQQQTSGELSLAKGFYELLCCFESFEVVFETLKESLAPGGAAIGPDSLWNDSFLPEDWSQVSPSTVPPGFKLYRTA